MTLKIRTILNRIKYPKSCEAQVRLVLECLDGDVVDVQVTNFPAEVSEPDDWVGVYFADDAVVYFRLNQAGEFCRIEKLIEFNQRFSRLAQQRRRKIRHIIQEPPRGGADKAYQVRIIDPEGHARTEVVVLEKRSLNEELLAQAPNGSVKVIVSGQGLSQNLASVENQAKYFLTNCNFVVDIGHRRLPIKLQTEKGVNYMEILESQLTTKQAEDGVSPINISVGVIDIPIRELLDLRPGSRVQFNNAGSGGLSAWIHLGLETVAKGQLVPNAEGWEFCVEEIVEEAELFAA